MGRAALMAAWTSRAALLMSRSSSNIREMSVWPSLLRELMLSSPAIAPSDCSSGMATLEAMVSGLAPGSEAETEIIGKSTCGSGATGRKRSASAPARTSARHSRDVPTGRRRNRAKNLMPAQPPAVRRRLRRSNSR